MSPRLARAPRAPCLRLSATPALAVTPRVGATAVALLASAGSRAAEEARTRSAAALARDNLWDHAHWRAAERLLRALDRPAEATRTH